MALTDENGGNGMIMPVQPMGYGGNYGGGNWGYPVPVMYGNNSGFGGGWGGDASWLILFIILAMGGNGFGGWGGFGGFGGGVAAADSFFPWLVASDTNTDNLVNAGFNQAATANTLSGIQSAVTSGFGDVQLGIAGVNQNICNAAGNIQNSLCNGFAGVNQTVQNGFAQAEISDNARQIANMQQAFNSQTAITGAINGLSAQQADCCCENRLATANLGAQIAREACSDRETVNNGVRDLLTSGVSNTQSLLNAINGGIQSIQDKLCQQELDAERRENQNLRTELIFARGQASQTDQTARLLDNNNAQTATIQAGQRALANEIEQYVNPTPVPAYIVQNPNCCTNSCGCNNGFIG